ncbi:MAG: hypothetical protein HBSAPP04_13200 [Ignavibacteriaceae bacterium]|nr:MAG: hypothetical protein HBSAPP04_13200 [Ignavibacteriaceae bacterium]
MNEFTTSGFINLFALFTLRSSDREGARRKVETFLLQSMGRRPADEFLALYDETLDFYTSTGLSGDKWSEATSALTGKLRAALTRRDLILLYLRLLELLYSGDGAKPETFGSLAALLPEIDERQREDLEAFTLGTGVSERFLLVSQETRPGQIRHINRGIKGELLIYHDAEDDLTVVRLTGKDPLFIESRILAPGYFMALMNGDSISGQNMVPLHYPDIMREFSGSSTGERITFTGRELEYHFPNGAFGLHSFSFTAASGSMIAIMGGSGAGKTTLLNILNGSLKPSHGIIAINGHDLHAEGKLLEGLTGYVPQEDMLLEDLTVRENIHYSARLSFSGLSREELDRRVDEVLKKLEIDQIAGLKVGSYLNRSISGGQRKRLNIAMELIREPAILLLDEPTSGLSSSDSEKVVRLMRELANSGKLVIMNIHQPSSEIFRMFDTLWLLDKGGYPVFTGAPLDAITHFKTCAWLNHPEERECAECGALNPELIFRIIEDTGAMGDARKTTPDEWNAIYREEEKKKEAIPETPPSPVHRVPKPSVFGQFAVYFERNLKVKSANRGYILVTLLQTPLLALLVSFFTWFSGGEGYSLAANKYIPVYIFMSVIVALFSGMMVSAEEIIRDRAVLKREKYLNLSRGSYINSKVLFLVIVSAIQSLVFVLIGNSILEVGGQFMLYWGVLFSASCVANLIGLNLSNSLGSAAAIYIFIPVILIPQILLGGLIIEYDDMPGKFSDNNNVPLIGDISTSRWAYEAIAVGQFRYNRYQSPVWQSEKRFYNYNWYGSILLHELERRLDGNTGGTAPLEKHDSIIVTTELRLIYDGYPSLRPSGPDLSRAGLLAEVRELKENFLFMRSGAARAKDSVLAAGKEKMGEKEFENFRDREQNDALADLVKRKDSYRYYRETDDRLIRLYAPVYKEPESETGDAHFYASDKVIAGYSIETPWLNAAVIWFQGLVLYFILLFNIPARFRKG